MTERCIPYTITKHHPMNPALVPYIRAAPIAPTATAVPMTPALIATERESPECERAVARYKSDLARGSAGITIERIRTYLKYAPSTESRYSSGSCSVIPLPALLQIELAYSMAYATSGGD